VNGRAGDPLEGLAKLEALTRRAGTLVEQLEQLVDDLADRLEITRIEAVELLRRAPRRTDPEGLNVSPTASLPDDALHPRPRHSTVTCTPSG
jgi:hypothetical protein